MSSELIADNLQNTITAGIIKTQNVDQRKANIGKKVVVLDDIEVFRIIPNSTNVDKIASFPKRVPPAEPIHHLSEEKVQRIISDTLQVVTRGQEQYIQQKLAIQKMMFLLHRVYETVELYRSHVETLNTFLVNNDTLQSQSYLQYCRLLPEYGDYAEVLEDAQTDVLVEDISTPLPQAMLTALTQDVVNTLYAAGSEIRVQRTICKNINKELDKRVDMIEGFDGNFPQWTFLLNQAATNQDVIQEELFQVSSYIAFLKAGDEYAHLH